MSEYKRLTDKEHGYKKCASCSYRNCQYCDDIYEIKEQAHTRLVELEDKIENGTLIELPCKVGDVMYEVIEGIPIQEWKIESICFDKAYPKGVIWAERTRDFAHWKFWIEDCGTKWFATKVEAEAKWRELEGEREC